MIELISGSEPFRNILVTVTATALLSLIVIASAHAAALRPQTRHAIALGCFAAMLLMPLFAALAPAWGSAVAASSEISDPVASDVGPVVGPEPLTGAAANDVSRPVAPGEGSDVSDQSGWSGALLAVWIAGIALLLVRRSLDLRERALIWREGRELPTAARNEVSTLLAELGVGRNVLVRTSDRAAVPMTWGVVRPRLILPRRASNWTETELRGVIVHECSHIRRFDAVSRTLAGMVVLLHWFNPLTALARKTLLHLTEEIADAEVVRETIDRRDYVRFLVSAARASGMVRSAEAMARRSGLERRARALMKEQARASIAGRAFAVAALGLAVVAIPLSAGVGRIDPAEPAPDVAVADRTPSVADATEVSDLARRSTESEAEYAERLAAALRNGVDASEVLTASRGLRTDAERQALFETLAAADPDLVSRFVPHLDLFRADAAAVDVIELICDGVTLSPVARTEVITRASKLRAAAAREDAVEILTATQPLSESEREALAEIAASAPPAPRAPAPPPARG